MKETDIAKRANRMTYCRRGAAAEVQHAQNESAEVNKKMTDVLEHGVTSITFSDTD